MKTSEFTYNLPNKLIAQYPPKERGTTNLLILHKETGNMEEKKYFDIPEYIQEGDVVVLNETKVFNCRTYFLTPKGKKTQVFFLEEVEDQWHVLIQNSKTISIGETLVHEQDNEIQISVDQKQEKGHLISFQKGHADQLFSQYGHTPLPPYMKREDEKEDKKRYNTVFGKREGSSAAPTASLNLTEDILKRIEEKGAKIVKVELKVGLGTFAPIRTENIEDHEIHTEQICVSEESARDINEAIQNRGRVWAFGTTVSRTLESVAQKEGNKYLIKAYEGSTNLYIYPGYEWKIVDILVTNFHMPDSSLILLVSSFAGKENIKAAYKYAINKNYKFLSYGDSMLII